MSHITYNAQAGDTFSVISKKVRGHTEFAGMIRSANPGVFEPIPEGTEILVPDGDPVTMTGYSAIPDALTLSISGTRFRFWDSVTIKKSIDAVDTLELNAPFDPDSPEFRSHFKPFSYNPITAAVGVTRIFTGTLITVKPVSSPDGLAVAAGAYSLPGVLVDCCAPASVYAEGGSLEFENADLRRIAEALLAPFNLRAVFVAPPGKPFEQVSVKPTDNIMPFLAKLAKQRNLVITSDAAGQVVFWQSNPGGNPVARLLSGAAGPLISVTPTFKTQDYYSHITGIEPTSIGLDGGQHTEKNSRLPGVLRPFTFEAKDAAGEDLSLATRAKMGRMFGDAVSYDIELTTWRDVRGQLWEPNTTLILQAPGAMIYQPYEFLIRDVTLTRNSGSATASLSLVIPAAYRGEVPERMPWE